MQPEKPKHSRRWSSRIIEILIVIVAFAVVIDFFAPDTPQATISAEPVIVIPATNNQPTNAIEAEDLFEQSSTLLSQEDYEGALALVNMAIEIAPNPLDRYYWQQAWLLGQVRQHEAAIDVYRTLLEKGSNRAYALGGLCYNYGSLSDFDAATDYCEAAGEYGSHSQFSQDAMCYIHGFTGHYELAVEECTDWIENNRHPYAYNNRSHAHLMLGNYWRTIQDATQSIERNTDRPEMPYTNRGLAQIALGQYTEGYADLMIAYGVDPTYPDIYLGLGQYHFAMGNTGDALENYCRYINMAWVTPSATILAQVETLGGCGD
jgi:tetratricopeptide (TPR) repeat protein